MQVSGHIVAVQEQRFRLATDHGRVYLLTLGRHTRIDPNTLAQLHRRDAHVEVDFSGEPNLTGGVAHSVREAAR